MHDLTFEGHNIRIVDRDGEPWWVLAEVCKVLEIANPSDVAKRLDDDEKSTLDSTEGGPDRIIVSEPGLYKIIMTSRKPVAKRFDRWVRHDVLPAIRKTGSYGAPAQKSELAQLAEVFVTGMREFGAALNLKLDKIQTNVRGELNQFKCEMLRDVDKRLLTISPRRKRIKPAELAKHIRFIEHTGGRCPLCMEIEIVRGGEIVRDENLEPIAEADHWYRNSDFDADHSILACVKICHPKLTRGSVARDQWNALFQAYQQRRREFEGSNRRLI